MTEIRWSDCRNPDCFQGTILNGPFDERPTEPCPECYGPHEEAEARYDADTDGWVNWSLVPDSDWDVPFNGVSQ
jgi:hypothetical protein